MTSEPLSAPCVIVGIGELGALFARGLLRLRHPVFPVNRGTPPSEIARTLPGPALVLVATGEADLDGVLRELPAPYKERVALLQNELLPHKWEHHGLTDPGVAVVWFEKKPDRPLKVLAPTVVGGQTAGLLAQALEAAGVPTRTAQSADELALELVVKNTFILVTNIAGLHVGGTAGQLDAEHGALRDSLLDEVIRLQTAALGHEIDGSVVAQRVRSVLATVPDHGLAGRSAPARLRRALQQAKDHHLSVPTLLEVARRAGLEP